MMRENQILHDIREGLGMEPDIALWRLNQGMIGPWFADEIIKLAPSLQPFKRALAEAIITIGRRMGKLGLVPGAADLIGILKGGRWFCLECKTARGDAMEKQRMWGELIRRMGGFYAVVRSVPEARAALERARKGEVG